MPTKPRAHARNKSNPPKTKAKRTAKTDASATDRRAAAQKDKAKREAERLLVKEAKAAERLRLKSEKEQARAARAAKRQAQFDDARRTKKLAALDRRWVDKINDPRQRALARVIPDICAIWGMEPDDLIGRTAAATPAEMVINSHRKTCTGAIIHLGLALGIRWNALHGRPAAVGQSGETEIRDLIDAHRQSLASFRLQFCALAGVDGPPMGEIGQLVRARFAPIRAAAFAEVGQAHAVAPEDEGVAA